MALCGFERWLASFLFVHRGGAVDNVVEGVEEGRAHLGLVEELDGDANCRRHLGGSMSERVVSWGGLGMSFGGGGKDGICLLD